MLSHLRGAVAVVVLTALAAPLGSCTVVGLMIGGNTDRRDDMKPEQVSVEPGTPMRVHLNSGSLVMEGTFVRRSVDTITIELENHLEREISFSGIDHVSVRLGSYWAVGLIGLVPDILTFTVIMCHNNSHC